jgi:hypothetical protein
MIVEFKYQKKNGEKGEAVQKINQVPAKDLEKTVMALDTSIRSVEILSYRKLR